MGIIYKHTSASAAAPSVKSHQCPSANFTSPRRSSIDLAKGIQWASDVPSVVYQPPVLPQLRRCLPDTPIHSPKPTNGAQHCLGRMPGLLDLVSYDTYIIGVAAACATIALVVWDKRKVRRSYPPGPSSYPVVGNYLDWPKGKIWEGFTQMAKEHSEQSLDSSSEKLPIPISQRPTCFTSKFWVAYIGIE